MDNTYYHPSTALAAADHDLERIRETPAPQPEAIDQAAAHLAFGFSADPERATELLAELLSQARPPLSAGALTNLLTTVQLSLDSLDPVRPPDWLARWLTPQLLASALGSESQAATAARNLLWVLADTNIMPRLADTEGWAPVIAAVGDRELHAYLAERLGEFGSRS